MNNTSKSPGEAAAIEIIKILKKNNRMRHGKLRDHIIKKEKICSKKTFDKTLELLVTSLQITKNKKPKNIVWYEVNDFSKKQNTYNQFFEEELKICEKNLELFLGYELIFNDNHKATLIHNIIENIHYLQSMILILQTLPEIKKSKIINDDLIKKIDNFKSLVYSKCSKFTSDQELLNHILIMKGSRFNKTTDKIKDMLDAIPY